MRVFSIVTRLVLLLLIGNNTLFVWNNTLFGQNEINTRNRLNNRQANDASVSPTVSTWNPASDPHPAVARILAYEKGAHSFGSGTLISSQGKYGVLLTNHHVVRDAVGLVQVHFPYGFASYAAVVYVDKTWDLAVLLISRPAQIPIVSLAKDYPKTGDPLWIAGYGSGNYRLAGGRCTKYVMPEIGLSNELIEVSINARQGDSGGPIFNRKGELAGVLFGSDLNNTVGSYCGRLRTFLGQAQSAIERVPSEPEQLFASIEPGSPQHRLNEGTVLAKIQSGSASSVSEVPLESLIGSVPAPKISSQASSIGRRGSASSRNTLRDLGETASSSVPLNFYPTFPSFEVRSSSGKAENVEQTGNMLRTDSSAQTGKSLPTERGTVERNGGTRNGTAGIDPGAHQSVQEKGVLAFSRSATVSDIKGPSGIPVTSTSSVHSGNDTYTIKDRKSVEPFTSGPVQSELQYASQVSTTHNNVSTEGAVVPASVLTPTLLPDQQLNGSDTQKNGRASETFLKTFQLVAIIVVVFFVLFHLIKLMSLIEENEQQESV